MTDFMRDEIGAPKIVDRATFQAELDALRVREKAHTHEGDEIAAARRRLPMVEMDSAIALIGPHGPVTLLDAFEGRRQLIAYYFMWHTGHPAPEQCEGCTWVTTQVAELSYLHSRDVTFAVFCQGPYEESARYHDFMGWEMPWYSALGSLDTLLVGRRVGRMHIVCYLRLILTEIGPDVSRFRNASAFASWLGLCPEKQISGGKVLSCKTRKVKNRAAIALRVGANSLSRAKGYFGEFFRRMRAKLGAAQAITATAHKIARVLYHVLLTREPYAETIFRQYDQQAQQRAEMRLRKQAALLGFQLVPNATPADL